MMVVPAGLLPARPSRLEEALRAVSPAGVVWATVQRQRGRSRFHRRVAERKEMEGWRT